jgi:hypothetical protein
MSYLPDNISDCLSACLGSIKFLMLRLVQSSRQFLTSACLLLCWSQGCTLNESDHCGDPPMVLAAGGSELYSKLCYATSQAGQYMHAFKLSQQLLQQHCVNSSTGAGGLIWRYCISAVVLYCSFCCRVQGSHGWLLTAAAAAAAVLLLVCIRSPDMRQAAAGGRCRHRAAQCGAVLCC